MAIAKELWHYNQVTAFPLSDQMIAAWTKSLVELKPEIEPEHIKKIIDMMKLDEFDVDYKAGIQNILRAYKRIQGDKIVGTIGRMAVFENIRKQTYILKDGAKVLVTEYEKK